MMYSDEQIRQIILDIAGEDKKLWAEAFKELSNTSDNRFLLIAFEFLDSGDIQGIHAAYEAIRLLEKLGKEKILEKVLLLFDNPIHCAWAIQMACGLDISIPYRLGKFMSHPDEEVRYTALVRLDGQPNTQQIALNALNDSSAKVRAKACRMLATLGNQDVVKALLSKLDDNEIGLFDEPVRFDAVNALGKIGDKTAIPALEAIVRNAANENITRYALYALWEIAENELEAFYLEQINHKDVEVRCRAIEYLGRSGNTEYINPLIQVSQNDTDYSVQFAAMKALINIGTSEALNAANYWCEHYWQADKHDS